MTAKSHVGYQGFQIVHPQLHDPTWLKTRYIDEGATLSEMAHELGATHAAIRTALCRFGLYQPTPRKDTIKLSRDLILWSAARVPSKSQLCDMLGISRSMYPVVIHRAGLTDHEVTAAFRRQTTAADRAAGIAERKAQRQAFYDHIVDLYTNQGQTIEQIGEALDRVPSGIYRILRKRGVDTTRNVRAGHITNSTLIHHLLTEAIADHQATHPDATPDDLASHLLGIFRITRSAFQPATPDPAVADPADPTAT